MTTKANITKKANAFRAFLETSTQEHNDTIERVTDSFITAETVNDNDLRNAEKAVKKEQHHIRKESKLLNLEKDAMYHASELTKQFARAQSGNDKEKVATLASALDSNDPEKLNSGIYRALLGLDKLMRNGMKEAFSVTEFSIHEAHKNNVRTSLTMLAKMQVLEQIKEARSVVGYKVKDADALSGMLALFK